MGQAGTGLENDFELRWLNGEVKLHNCLVFRHGDKSNGVLVGAGGLEVVDINFVTNSSLMIFGGGIFGHDNLSSFAVGDVGKLAKIGRVGEIVAGANASGDTTAVDSNGIEAKTIGGIAGPEARGGLGAIRGITDGVGDLGGGVDP